MLRLKKGITIDVLKQYGFKREGEGQYYYFRNEECEIFVWRSRKGDDYIQKGLYIEVQDYTMILSDLDIIYKLIKDDLVEVV